MCRTFYLYPHSYVHFCGGPNWWCKGDVQFSPWRHLTYSRAWRVGQGYVVLVTGSRLWLCWSGRGIFFSFLSPFLSFTFWSWLNLTEILLNGPLINTSKLVADTISQYCFISKTKMICNEKGAVAQW